MTDLDRVTDLFEKWAAEENEHRQAGEYGLAEGLRVAIEDLREAVHGRRAEEQSGYTVQQTAAHFARRVQRVSDRIRSAYYQRSVSDIVALDNVEGFLDRIARDDLDVFAAGRAETTTATDEDAEAAVVDALGQSPFAHHEVIPSGETASTLYITHDDEWADLASLIVQMLTSRGLLATARTRPTREQIAQAIFDSPTGEDWYACQEAADAVLALLADRPTEAEAGARALEEAEARMPAFHDRDAPEWAITSACKWLRERAAALRAGERRG